MANANDANVTQSVLDRLIEPTDRELTEQAGGKAAQSSRVERYKAGVRRDLQWLLNTKRIPDPDGKLKEFEQTSKSIYNYGILDFSILASTSSKDRNRLITDMEETIRVFEPRLKNVKVKLVNDDGLTTKRLRFQLDARLMMDPLPEQITFETVLDVVSGNYEVKG